MTNLGVSLQDYAGGGLDNQVLFDQANISQEQLADLSKALEAGSITGGDSRDSAVAGQGAALKVESLERNLKLLTFREQDIQLWKYIPKDPAYNTVEEYNQLKSYGADRGGFNNEGELPEEEDSTYVRRAELVKFLGVTKSVTHPMTLVNLAGVANAVQKEIANGTMWILRKTDRALTIADSTIIPQEFNGLYVQQQRSDSFSSLANYWDSENVIDLRGVHLTQEDIEDGAQGILNNFGAADVLFAPPKVLGDFGKDFYEKQRLLLGNSGDVQNGVVGSRPKVCQTTVGDVNLMHDIFMRKPTPKRTTTVADSTKAPAAVASVSLAAAAGGALSRFAAGDAGDYFYAVAAVNRYGESSLTQIGGGAVSLTAGQSADLTFTDGGGSYPATGYVVYRSKKDPAGAIADTDLFPILWVSTAELAAGYDGGAAGAVRDNNRVLPDTDQAFMIEGTTQVWNFKQLAPLMKMDLAIVSPAYRFMVLLYGTPMLYAPKKMVRFVNVGPYVAS